MSPIQRCFSDLVCQPLVTSYVIDAYLCLAMLHAWIIRVGLPAHEALRLMVAGLLLRKQEANGQLEKTTDPPSQRLAQQGPEGCQRPTAIYAEEI